MKLTREQELMLIELGFKQLLAGLHTANGIPRAQRVPWNKGKHTGPRKKTGAHKWTPKQRAKFIKTMKAKWAERKAKEAK
jgi:hypothetical protein